MSAPIAFVHMQLAITQGVGFRIACFSKYIEGLPPRTLEAHPEYIQLKFDAEYHDQNLFDFNDEGGIVAVQVSFDSLVTIRIPGSSIAAFVIQLPVTAPDDYVEPKPKPTLRLVE